MAQRSVVALLAGLLLLAAACDDTDAETADNGEAGAQADGDAPEALDPVQLADGVAGTVDDEEISDEEVAQTAEELSRNPQIQAEMGQGLLVEELLPTLALEQVIQTRVFERGAADLGVEVAQADLEAAEAELVEQAGGQEQFDEQVEQSGLSEQGLEDHLRVQALFEGVIERLDVEEPADDDEAPMAANPGQQAVQEWLFDQLRESDIAVDERYGVWIDEQAALMPPEELLPEQPPMPEGMEGLDPEELEDMDPEELDELLEQLNS